MTKKFELTQDNRMAIADLLTNYELFVQDNGTYLGKNHHSEKTMKELIEAGYAEAKKKRGTKIVSVIPTPKAVYLIPVNL